MIWGSLGYFGYDLGVNLVYKSTTNYMYTKTFLRPPPDAINLIFIFSISACFSRCFFLLMRLM